jgi:hypothetical protein
MVGVVSLVRGRRAARPARSSHERQARLRWWRSGRLLAALALVPVAAGCERPPCEPPYLPAQVVEHGAAIPPPFPWPLEGTARPSALGPLDTDGDGVEDMVTPPDGSSSAAITIGRASGDLVLTGAPSIKGGLMGRYTPSWMAVGDVDGDGRSDLVVMTLDEGGFQTGNYLVPGSTPAGSYHPADVGVLLFGAGVRRDLYAVGDYDEDGVDDVGIYGDDGRTYVVSGPQVAAPGPGGTLPVGSIEPLAQISGRPVGVLRLMPDVAAVATVGASPIIALSARGGSLLFGLGQDVWSYPPYVDVAVADGPAGERWLVADVWQRFRGVRYVWDLDHPCGTPPAPT